MVGLLLEQADQVLVVVSAPTVRGGAGGWSPSPAVAESRIVMPPCATSDVLPDQQVTMEIFDAGMRRCTSINSRGEATKSW